MISVGGADTAVIQWKYKQSAETVETIFEEQYDSEIEKEKNNEYVSRSELLQPGTHVYLKTSKIDVDSPTDDGRDNPTVEQPPTGGLFQLGGGSDVVHAARPSVDYDAGSYIPLILLNT